jgi:hypothetical protein
VPAHRVAVDVRAPIIDHGVVQRWISEARVKIEQVRLLVLKTAWLMDTVGNRGARIEVSAIKVAAPEVATWVIDRAIQAHGGAGVSQDHLLAELYAVARILQIADGPDEVHYMAIARRETPALPQPSRPWSASPSRRDRPRAGPSASPRPPGTPGRRIATSDSRGPPAGGTSGRRCCRARGSPARAGAASPRDGAPAPSRVRNAPT